jgi:hypothetical protein
MIIASIDKINLTLEKSNRPPIDPNTLIMSISNRARTAYKKRMSGDMYKSTGNYINQ